MRDLIRVGAALNRQWAGAPMPLKDLELIIEPTYPNAEVFRSLGKQEEFTPEDEIPPEELIHIKGAFWSTKLRRTVIIIEKQGRRFPMYGDTPRRVMLDCNTIGASYAWGIEQEHNALQLLGTLLRHNCFKQYLLTGMFFETSRRSGITYMFRKLKPTVALRANKDNNIRALCALCLHPIALYGDSWAGAMCPTDDVIAHLMLMRGDEHMFWKRANQHSPDRPEAGL